MLAINLTESLEQRNWRVINDSVMGGLSQADVSVSDRGLLFEGRLSLDNNGGFSSIRRALDAFKFEQGGKIHLEVLGDGRQYQFRMRLNNGWDGVSYRAIIPTVKGQTVSFDLSESDFTPVWRGRTVLGAPPMQFDRVKQIGFMLADKTPGTFSLLVEHISQSQDRFSNTVGAP